MKRRFGLGFSVQFAMSVGIFLAAPFGTLLAQGGNEVYAYLGSDYTEIAALKGPYQPYSTTDFISGLFTMSSPLAPNLVMQPITPLSYSFSDGYLDYDSGNVTASRSTFDITTDQYGTVTDAYINLYVQENNAPPALGPASITAILTICPIVGLCTDGARPSGSADTDVVFVVMSLTYKATATGPGEWGPDFDPPSGAPEPASIALTATGLLTLAFLARMRNRAANR